MTLYTDADLAYKSTATIHNIKTNGTGLDKYQITGNYNFGFI